MYYIDSMREYRDTLSLWSSWRGPHWRKHRTEFLPPDLAEYRGRPFPFLFELEKTVNERYRHQALGEMRNLDFCSAVCDAMLQEVVLDFFFFDLNPEELTALVQNGSPELRYDLLERVLYPSAYSESGNTLKFSREQLLLALAAGGEDFKSVTLSEYAHTFNHVLAATDFDITVVDFLLSRGCPIGTFKDDYDENDVFIGDWEKETRVFNDLVAAGVRRRVPTSKSAISLLGCFVKARYDFSIMPHLLQFYRDRYSVAVEMLSHGVLMGIMGEEAGELIGHVGDAQNVHTTLVASGARRLVRTVRGEMGGIPKLTAGEMGDIIANLTDDDILRIQADHATTAGQSLAAIREAIGEACKRFYLDLGNFSFVGLKSGAEALGLVYSWIARSDPHEAALAVASGLLQSHSEYRWRANSCPQGSVSMVLQQLEGRLGEEEPISSGGNQDQSAIPDDVAAYHEEVKRIATESPQVLHSEALARFMRIDKIRATTIFEAIIMGEDLGWAECELRGSIFDALREEAAEILAKLLTPGDEEDADDEELIMLPGMLPFLGDLQNLSALFTDRLMHGLGASGGDDYRVDVLFKRLLGGAEDAGAEGSGGEGVVDSRDRT